MPFDSLTSAPLKPVAAMTPREMLLELADFADRLAAENAKYDQDSCTDCLIGHASRERRKHQIVLQTIRNSTQDAIRLFGCSGHGIPNSDRFSASAAAARCREVAAKYP